MLIRPALLSDLKILDALRRREQESVGFIPMSRYEREIGRVIPTLLVGEENGDAVAFTFWTPGFPVARIQQIVVRPDARRQERATALVNRIIAEAGVLHLTGVTCRCREDVESLAFWDASGFRRVRREDGGRRRIPLWRYYRQIGSALFDLGEYVAPTNALIGLRRGFRLWRKGTAHA